MQIYKILFENNLNSCRDVVVKISIILFLTDLFAFQSFDKSYNPNDRSVQLLI